MTLSTHQFPATAPTIGTITIDEEKVLAHEEHDAPPIDFRGILFVLRRNLLLIAGVVAMMVALAFIATMLTTPRYVATTQLQINQEADRVLQDSSVVQPEESVWDMDRFLNTQVTVIKSRTMALRVARSLGLVGKASFFEAMVAPPPKPRPGVPPAQLMEEATVGLILANLTVNLPRESRVASVSFRSPDPELATRVANAYGREFIASNLQRKFNSSAYARDFLAGQLANAKSRLERSERDLNDYARSAGLIRTVEASTDSQGRSQPAQSVTGASLTQLNAAALNARADRIASEGKWRTVANLSPFNIPDVLTNQAVQQLTQQYAVALAALEQERVRHLDGHPSVITAQAQVRELREQRDQLANQIKRSLYENYQSATKREAALNQQVNDYKAATLSEQERGVRYNILSRETDTNRTLYEGLLQRYKEVSAAAGVSANNVSVVDEASRPLLPSSPRLLVNLALGLLGGLAAALALVFVREQLDDVIRGPDDVEQKLSIPVLGTIPMSRDADGDVAALLDDTKSEFAEAYNALRTSLLYSSPQGLPQVLLVTSSEAGEGKTTTSYAIARALTKLDKSVVLISADLRKPSLHKLFDMSNAIGMTDALISADTVLPLVQKSAFEQLSVIPSGPIPPDPTALLAAPRLRVVIKELAENFDVVLIDGPPVLGLADAPLLSSIAQGTIFVIEANRGSRGRTKAATRRLRTAQGTILGAVLTKLDLAKAGQYYGYAGYDYYSYGNEKARSRLGDILKR